jgi:hypothetical protein
VYKVRSELVGGKVGEGERPTRLCRYQLKHGSLVPHTPRASELKEFISDEKREAIRIGANLGIEASLLEFADFVGSSG